MRKEQSKNKIDIEDALQAILAQQQALSQRLEELEEETSKHNGDNKALLQMVNFLYDTDDKHIYELTRIPIQSARPLALGIMLDSLFDPDVQSGEVPLSHKLRLAYLRLMRSVGGVHLGRGMRLAEEQAAAEAEKVEELELGGD